MRKQAYTTAFVSLISLASANLPLPKITIQCNSTLPTNGCMTGMTCGADNICHMPVLPPPDVMQYYSAADLAFFQSLGKNATDSQLMFKEHKKRQDQSLPSENGMSINASHIPPGPPITTASGFTTDGSCGNIHGTVILCGEWPQGDCCSAYGLCGDDSSHCGDGCQSGNCSTVDTTPGKSPVPAPVLANGGQFETVGLSGVPAMHAALLPNGKVVFLDKEENITFATLPNGRPAYSTEYDPSTNTFTSLAYQNNAFCSCGQFLADGQLVSIGGNGAMHWFDPVIGDGRRSIRFLNRSSTDDSLHGDWQEFDDVKLSSNRWYPSAQILPDGRVFVASGSLNGFDPTNINYNNPTYEILDTNGHSEGVSIKMDILARAQPYHMYPFLHVLNDGQLFVFADKSSQVFNVQTGEATKHFPDLTGEHRNYPNTGGSVMLAMSSANNWSNTIIICGGGAYQDPTSPTDPSCGTIEPGDGHAWQTEAMPDGRTMTEGILLPNGKIVWMNGGHRGSQGFSMSRDAALTALLYDPELPFGQRFSQLASSPIPRVYHSVALLLLDGTIMVAGSNQNEEPLLSPTETEYPTEYRVERFTPPYLSNGNADRRPADVQIPVKSLTADGSKFQISFTTSATSKLSDVKISLYHGGFVTHSIHMGQRLMFLDFTGFQEGSTQQTLVAQMPPNNNVAPPGPYNIFVVVDDIPSVGQFVMVK